MRTDREPPASLEAARAELAELRIDRARTGRVFWTFVFALLGVLGFYLALTREVVFHWYLAAGGGALALATLTNVIRLGAPSRHYIYHDRIQYLEGFLAAAETMDRRSRDGE